MNAYLFLRYAFFYFIECSKYNINVNFKNHFIMATRSNIALRLRDEDVENGIIYLNKTFKGHRYLQIYCHFDGYLEGVGMDLVNKHFTYESAKEFILRGDRPSCTDPDETYYERGEDYSEVCPEELDDPKIHNEYLYIIEENKDTGKIEIFMCTYHDDKGPCKIG